MTDGLDTTQLLTVSQVSQRLQIKKSTVYLYATVGKIPCVKIGKLVRFDPVVLEMWLKRQRVRVSG